jgi:multidrug efflux pump subunit AcrA (membrane-fusion protein)
VRLTAFNSRSSRMLDGRVVYLSADKLDTERGDRSFYLVRVALPPQPGTEAMQAGMRAEVFLKTAPRTPLQYLLEPLTSAWSRAAREP